MTDRPYLPEPDPVSGADQGWQQPGQPEGLPPSPAHPAYGYVADEAGYAPAPSYPGHPGYPGYPGYPSYPGYPGYPGYPAMAPQTSGRAIAVMVLGISSLTLCWLGLIPAIVAVAMATRARREIDESGGRVTGLGMVTAGRITSWITIGVAGALALIVLLAVLLGNSVGPSSPSAPGPLP